MHTAHLMTISYSARGGVCPEEGVSAQRNAGKYTVEMRIARSLTVSSSYPRGGLPNPQHYLPRQNLS